MAENRGDLRVSVVITTFNRREVLARTLPTVLNQDFPSREFEVIVVVDGSNDGTSEMLKAFRPACALRVIEQANRGQAAAMNVGLRAAQGDVILFLDDDIVCDPRLLWEHAHAHKNAQHPLLAIGLLQVSPESLPNLATDWIARDWASHFGPLLQGVKPTWHRHGAVQANRSVSVSALAKTGGFDESLDSVLHFNTDLGLRLWKQGVELQFLPRAVAQEIYCKSTRKMFQESQRLAQGAWRISRKHPELRSYSSIAKVTRGGAGKQWLRGVAARMPMDPSWPLRMPLWVAERLRRIPAVQETGLRMLGKGLGVVIWRAAMREAGSWDSLRREFGARVPALMYHNVGPYQSETSRSLTVSPGLFRRQMHWLVRRGYTGISISEWLEWRRTGKSLPEKPVLLTFDDAYEAIVENALPVVRGLGFSATVFVITGYVGRSINWNPQIEDGPFKLMTAAQIREWSEKGIEFGAHTRTHPRLTTLDDALLETEVAGSREDLARLLGKQVISFAYPYGDKNEKVQDSARRNFSAAFTTHEGMNTLLTDPADFRRTMVWPDNSMLDFALKLRLGASPITQHFGSRLKAAFGKRLRRLFG